MDSDARNGPSLIRTDIICKQGSRQVAGTRQQSMLLSLDSKFSAGGVAAGNMQFQAPIHVLLVRPQSEFRTIIVLGKMANACPLQATSSCLREQLSRFDVRQVTTASPDSGLQKFGIRTVIQHARVVVTFEQHRIERTKHLFQLRKYVPEIGEDSKPDRPIIDNETDTVCPIMGCRNRLDSDRTEVQRVARGEMA